MELKPGRYFNVRCVIAYLFDHQLDGISDKLYKVPMHEGEHGVYYRFDEVSNFLKGVGAIGHLKLMESTLVWVEIHDFKPVI